MIARLAHLVRRSLARSRTVARVAVRARRQLDGIVLERLGHDIDPDRNGEHWVLDALRSDIRRFVDVGANTGSWSAAVLARCADAEGILLEPSPRAADALERELGRDRRIRVVRAAASDRRGELTLYEEPLGRRTSSVVPGFSSNDARPTTVPTRRVDELLAERGWEAVDFLKIDAEGHDLHVLRGASGALASQAVRFLQFEYNEPWRSAGARLGDALSFLDASGYDAFLLKGRGLHRFRLEIYGEFYHYANFVAFPRSRLGELGHLVRGEI